MSDPDQPPSAGREFSTNWKNTICRSAAHAASEIRINRGALKFDEHHPSRGEVGKEINHANERIEELVPKFEELLALNPNSEDYAESVRDSLSDLLSVSRDYVDARADFVYTTFGPGGTIRSDMAAAEHLASLNALEATLAEGLENVRGHFCLYPEDDA